MIRPSHEDDGKLMAIVKIAIGRIKAYHSAGRNRVLRAAQFNMGNMLNISLVLEEGELLSASSM
ncbi:hypothetical protein [Paenibacillus sp. HB172176]|uniref:hypothetical protein n=1 Tax=Paenibacillus sp. HB172176 TaxID=2493690 RepID=UPI001438B2A6|nr:hypothetical protein [Paenibacillus sp. HB172176]